MKKSKILSNQIIEEYKLNLDLKSFPSFLSSLKYISDEQLILRLCEESNDNINQVVDIIKEKYPIYDLEDALCYYIHLLNNKDIVSYYLTDNELDLLINILNEDEALIDIASAILIYNYRKKYALKIDEILKWKRNKQFSYNKTQFVNFYDVILQLLIVKKSYFLSSSKQPFIRKLLKQNEIYNYLVELGHKHFADLLIKYLQENDYNSLYNLINSYQLNDNIKEQIKNIITSCEEEKYDLSDFDLSFLNTKSSGVIGSRLLKKTIKILAQYKESISNDKKLSENNTLKVLLEIKEMYKEYYIDSEYLMGKYGKEKTILKGAYAIMQLALNENVSISKLDTKDKLINLIKTNKPNNLNMLDIKNMLILLDCNKDGVLKQEEALRQTKDILGLEFNSFKKDNLNAQERLIKYRNYLSCINSTSLSEVDKQYEIFMQMFEYNQKRILDLIYQDNFEDSFDVFLLELKNHLSYDKYNELVFLDENYKKLASDYQPKSPSDKALDIVDDEIKRLKEAYEHITILEQTYNESFATKKQNICEEILKLQKNEINILLDKAMLENKPVKAIEVSMPKKQKRCSIDPLNQKVNLNLKVKK